MSKIGLAVEDNFSSFEYTLQFRSFSEGLLASSYISTNLFSISYEGILENWEVVENKIERVKAFIGK